MFGAQDPLILKLSSLTDIIDYPRAQLVRLYFADIFGLVVAGNIAEIIGSGCRSLWFGEDQKTPDRIPRCDEAPGAPIFPSPAPSG